jgi:hypothetical protein
MKRIALLLISVLLATGTSAFADVIRSGGAGTGGPLILDDSITAADSDGLCLYDDGANLGMCVEDGGDVGVGLTNPTANFSVQAKAGIAAASPILLVSSNNAAGILSVTHGGNVGIGTTSPGTLLEIVGGTLKFGTANQGIQNFDGSNVINFTGNNYTKVGSGANTAHGLNAIADVRVPGELEVGEQSWFDNALYVGGADASMSTFTATGEAQFGGTGDSWFTGNVGIGSTAPTATLDVQGGVVFGSSSTATSFTFNAEAKRVFVSDTSSAWTVTIDTDLLDSGREFCIHDTSGAAGTNNITVATEGAEDIDGADTVPISANYGSLCLVSDGTNWFSW